MRKDEFLSSQAVIGFAFWMEFILDAPQSFVHGYFHSKERKAYEFERALDPKMDRVQEHAVEVQPDQRQRDI